MTSNYPAWWDTTITIYNRLEDSQTQLVTWYRHTVSGCFWDNLSDKINIDKTVLETNNIICRIPVQSNYLEAHEWSAASAATMSNYFTLGINDIIVKGEVTDTINEYQSGYRATDLLTKYKKLQGCLQIQSYSINTRSGVGLEHYYVRGI